MAFGRILRRPLSTARNLAIRVAGNHQHHYLSSLSRITDSNLFQILSAQHFSSITPGSDQSLLQTLDWKIKSLREDVLLPEDFEFVDSEDGPRLNRQYNSETITVSVKLPKELPPGIRYDSDFVSFHVRVSKQNQQYIDFGGCVTTNTFEIESVIFGCLKHDEPGDELTFKDLSETSQKAFREYLEARGIKHYTLSAWKCWTKLKDYKKDLDWLERAKKVVES